MQETIQKSRKKLIGFSIFCGIILITLSYLFYLLSSGILIASLNFWGIQTKGLYLKLDNKLILNIEELNLTQRKVSSTKIPTQKAIEWFQDSLIAISYFQQIHIKDIILSPQDNASIFYDGKKYQLTFPTIKAEFEIAEQENSIAFEVRKIKLEEFQVNLNGSLDFYPTKRKITFNFVATSALLDPKTEEKLIIKGDSNLKTLNVSAYSTPFKSLEVFQKDIQRIPALYDWLLVKSSFDEVRIKNLFFSAPLDEDFLPRLLKSLYAEVDIKNVALRLKEEFQPIQTSALKITFKNQVLNFLLDKPSYRGILLEGSKVELHNLGHTPKTLVFLKSKNAMLDARIHDILKAYNVDFDVHQNSSTLDVDLTLSFESQKDHSIVVGAEGIFRGSETDLNIYGLPIYAKTLDVGLQISEKDKFVFINNSIINMQMPQLEGSFEGTLDLNQKTLQSSIKPQIFALHFGDASFPISQIFSLQENSLKSLRVNLDYSSTPTITIPDLEASLSLDTKKHIHLMDLSKIYPHSPMLQYLDLSSGEVAIQTTDLENFDVQAQFANLNYPLFDKKWNRLSELQATLKISPQSIHGSSLDDSIIFDYSNDFLKVKLENKNFDWQEFQNTKTPFLSLANTQTSIQNPSPQPKEPSPLKVYLESKYTNLRYKDYDIPTDEIYINYKDSKIKVDATHKNGIINLDLYDNIAKFKANNFGANFVNTLFQKEVVQGGLFGIKGIYKNNSLRAEVEIQNTVFKNFAALQNIVGLIDTIPSLIVFKKPGLGVNGYQVNKGRIVFEMNDTYLGLKKIDLIGSSIDVGGGGLVTLANQELNISLTISTIKSLSEVLNKIPIVGYLLLGKEGKISTGLILKGTLEDPKSEVTIAQDLITAPFKIIERIFTPE